MRADDNDSGGVLGADMITEVWATLGEYSDDLVVEGSE